MNKRANKTENSELPSYTHGEEIFNMVTHIVGAVLGIIMLVLGIIRGAELGVKGILCAIAFGVCMIILYTMSAVYHGLSPRLKAKKVMQVLDHCSVFLLIAGTYTPVTLCALMNANLPLAWVIFGVVWGVSVLGIVLNAINVKKFMAFSMTCYIALGWCIILSFPLLMTVLPAAAIWLLFIGGVAYTLGAIMFGLGTKKRYMHSVFHIFVVVGSLLHGLAVLLFIL